MSWCFILVTTCLTCIAANPHALTEWSDPAGRLQLKAEYDSQGRVIKQTDALGQSVSISHQDSQRRQSVKDRLGHTTVYDYDERGNVTPTPLGEELPRLSRKAQQAAPPTTSTAKAP